MKFSVIVTTYKRYSRLELVLKSWLKSGASELILANGGKWFNTDLKIKQYLFNPDPGNKIRFSSAALAEHEFVVLADDDVIAKPGILVDFEKWYIKKPGIYGVIGRLPNSDDYFKCSFIRASNIIEPIETFFVGVIYFAHSRDLPTNLKPLENRAYDDLYWCMVAKRNIKKYVLPTINYENLKPECNEAGSIFKTPESKIKRNEFYKKYRFGG